LVDVSAAPRTIHAFWGFPDALYEQHYPAKGDPALARDVIARLADYGAAQDDRWGLDHGAWTLLKYLYPKADVPVFQLSIDMSKALDWHLAIGKTLSELREHGVLLLGSGNVVHNLHAMRRGGAPQDFALEFDSLFAERLTDRDFKALADQKSLGPLLSMAHPSLDHYIPALTIAGASDEADELTYMTESIDLGSVSMRSFLFHSA
jgi:4,5-DOPA dioxygenase extradiol